MGSKLKNAEVLEAALNNVAQITNIQIIIDPNPSKLQGVLSNLKKSAKY